MKKSSTAKHPRKVLVIRRRKNNKRVVYTQWDPQTKRRVVIKRYSNQKRAEKERQVMASYAQSSHLVNLINYYTRRGRGYIVMEWVAGRSIKRTIQRRGRLPILKAVSIARNILAGLDTLHQNGYIHGDLMTDNVIITDYDAASIKIIDFEHAAKIDSVGKARLRRHLPEPPYKLPPETSKRAVDITYDIYGVGFICACMVTGKFLSRRPRHRDQSARATDFWSVIQKAMQKNPHNRYRSAREMAEALTRAISISGSENQNTFQETVR